MRIFFDESVNSRLARELPATYICERPAERGWSGVQNGELCRLVGEAGFDAMLTCDKTMYREVETQLKFPVLVLDAFRGHIAVIRLFRQRIVQAIEGGLTPGFHSITVDLDQQITAYYRAVGRDRYPPDHPSRR